MIILRDFSHFNSDGAPKRLSITSFEFVLAGLVPAISLRKAQPCLYDRDRRDEPGDDDGEWIQLVGTVLAFCKRRPLPTI
jgi:hypothetical protein